MKNHFFELPISTRDGEFTARYSENGLAELSFPGGNHKNCGGRIQAKPQSAIRNPQLKGWHRTTETALKNLLGGRAAKHLPPLDWSAGTEFQKRVWRELRKIPAGKTKSYGEIAARIGRPKAVRAVGGACGANPIPVLVPCHRILAANKKIGGFSGGLDWKRKLLAREGTKF